jgi:cysteinyl-tRNA synthetase
VSDLPQPAVEHLYPFLILGSAAVAALIALVATINKGRLELRTMMRDQIREAYSFDDQGKPGIAAQVTMRIVSDAFSTNLDHLTRALGDVEAEQKELRAALTEHERKEFERGDQRDTSLKAEVARTISDALRFPKEVAHQYQLVRSHQEEQGKQLDSHEHRIRLLEAK